MKKHKKTKPKRLKKHEKNKNKKEKHETAFFLKASYRCVLESHAYINLRFWISFAPVPLLCHSFRVLKEFQSLCVVGLWSICVYGGLYWFVVVCMCMRSSAFVVVCICFWWSVVTKEEVKLFCDWIPLPGRTRTRGNSKRCKAQPATTGHLLHRRHQVLFQCQALLN